MDLNEYKAFLDELKQLGVEEYIMADILFEKGYTSPYQLARAGVSSAIIHGVRILMSQKAASQTGSQINVTIGNIYVLDGKTDLKTMLALAGINGVDPKQITSSPKVSVKATPVTPTPSTVVIPPLKAPATSNKFANLSNDDDEDDETDYDDN